MHCAWTSGRHDPIAASLPIYFYLGPNFHLQEVKVHLPGELGLELGLGVLVVMGKYIKSSANDSPGHHTRASGRRQ